MSSAWGGSCYGVPVDALSAFQASFPQVNVNGVLNLTTASIAGDPGVISYSIRMHDLTSNAVNIRAGTVQLTTCDTGKISVQDSGVMIFIGVAVLVYAIGLLCGLNR